MLKTYNQFAGQSLHRLEALSDGVFAIAMTLLVLDLKVPVHELVHTEQDLYAAFCDLAPKFLSYCLGFMTLGIFWVGQSTQFSIVEHSDRGYAWWHLFFLAIIGLLPFSTAFLSEFIAYRFPLFLYWLNILAAGILIYVSLEHARRHRLLREMADQKTMLRLLRRRVIVAQLWYAGGALLVLVNTYLSIAVILAVQLNYALGLTGNTSKRKQG